MTKNPDKFSSPDTTPEETIEAIQEAYRESLNRWMESPEGIEYLHRNWGYFKPFQHY